MRVAMTGSVWGTLGGRPGEAEHTEAGHCTASKWGYLEGHQYRLLQLFGNSWGCFSVLRVRKSAALWLAQMKTDGPVSEWRIFPHIGFQHASDAHSCSHWLADVQQQAEGD